VQVDRNLGLTVALRLQVHEHALSFLLDASVAFRASEGQGLARPKAQAASDLVLAQGPVAGHEDLANAIVRPQVDGEAHATTTWRRGAHFAHDIDESVVSDAIETALQAGHRPQGLVGIAAFN
jgi:hypothetical protein